MDGDVLVVNYNLDAFKSEFHYKYVRLLLKDLSFAESSYLRFLRDGLDNHLISVYSFLDEYGEDLNGLHDQEDWDEYFRGSWLEMVLITLMNDMLDANRNRINDFYNQGSYLSHSHMQKPQVFLDSDKKALDNLTEYVGSVVQSINDEYTIGLKKSIGEHIEDGSLDDLKSDLLILKDAPIVSPFSVDTRCVFATKTEYARCVNTGLLQGYSNYGVDLYDWVTTGLPNVCSRCHELEDGSPYTLNQICGLLPVHVNCACSVKARLPKVLYLSDVPSVVDLTPMNIKK